MLWLLAAALYAVALGIGISALVIGDEPAATQSRGERRSATAVARSVAAEDGPDVRRILARNIFDWRTGPLWPPPPPPEPVIEKAPKPPEPGPCEDELRISGTAYMSPEHGRPLVVFSGSDVQHSGARGVGMRIADKTVIAIYPNVVVLAGDEGAQCWVKMYGPHAQEVAEAERREEAREAAERRREEAKKKRRAARKRKKKP